MTKQDLIEAITITAQESYGSFITKKMMDNFFTIICATIATEVANGGNVVLPGIGTLRVKLVPERMGTNPRTGQKMQIPAHFSLKVSTAEAMKAALATCPMPNDSTTPELPRKQRKGA